MKEKFRDKKFHKNFSVTLTNKQVWSAKTADILDSIDKLVSTYMSKDITMTLRQLYYQLVAEGLIPNDQKVYKKLSTLVADARYAGLIDWDAIEDRGRVPSMPSEWNNIGELMESAMYSYRLPRWEGQDNYIELVTEKDALSSILHPISRKWHIGFSANKGYSSASAMYGLFRRICGALSTADEPKFEKYVTILYLGDHDPSGLDMVRDIKERILEFLGVEFDYFGLSMIEDHFNIEHIALTDAQIRQYNPPHNPAKLSDPRADWYIKRHGNKSWEVDALKPDVMIDIVEKAIKIYVDVDAMDLVKTKERYDKTELRRYIKKIGE